MKTQFKLILLGAFLIGIFNSDAVAQKVLDKPWIKENTPTRRVVPYTHVREADVMWSTKIERVIDLREKMNQVLRCIKKVWIKNRCIWIKFGNCERNTSLSFRL